MKKSKKTIILILSVILIGLILLLVGGILAGWDILGALTSKTAILIYFVTPFVVATIIFFVWRSKTKK